MPENENLPAATPTPPVRPPARSAFGDPGNAIWFFVGATFLFAWSSIWGGDGSPVFRIVLMVLGFVVFAGGILEWRRASRAAAEKAAGAAGAANDPGTTPPESAGPPRL